MDIPITIRFYIKFTFAIHVCIHIHIIFYITTKLFFQNQLSILKDLNSHFLLGAIILIIQVTNIIKMNDNIYFSDFQYKKDIHDCYFFLNIFLPAIHEHNHIDNFCYITTIFLNVMLIFMSYHFLLDVFNQLNIEVIVTL